MEQQKSDQSVSDAQWAGEKESYPLILRTYDILCRQSADIMEKNTEAEWLWTAGVSVWKQWKNDILKSKERLVKVFMDNQWGNAEGWWAVVNRNGDSDGGTLPLLWLGGQLWRRKKEGRSIAVNKQQSKNIMRIAQPGCSLWMMNSLKPSNLILVCNTYQSWREWVMSMY